jgi:sirohydrochlorin cobaltochelatase
MSSSHAVLLVGHGAPPRDFPRDLVARLKALEGRRVATGGTWTEEERELDTKIRSWPRTAENDPYREGLLALADALRAKLDGAPLFVAYNEFCGPSIEDAVAEAIGAGATSITVVPSMLTPGGVHSEVEIPAILGELRAEHPAVTIRYAWPFDLQRVAGMLAEQVGRAV